MGSEQDNKLSYLAVEMFYRKYSVDHDKVKSYFTKLDIRDYVALHLIEAAERNEPSDDGRVYLRYIAEKMEMPMRMASNMARELESKGLVRWSHDGDGSEGTYLMITDAGRKILGEQETITRDHFKNIIKEFGRDNLTLMLNLIEQFDDIIEHEMEKDKPENEQTAGTEAAAQA